MDLNGGDKQALSVSMINEPSGTFFTESVEPDHSDHYFHKRIAKNSYYETSTPEDSQAKYGIVARGEAVLYLRILHPRNKFQGETSGSCGRDDHRGGGGGRVTDAFGRLLDFSSSIKMTKNYGNCCDERSYTRQGYPGNK